MQDGQSVCVQKEHAPPLGLLMAWLGADASGQASHSEWKKKFVRRDCHGVRLAARKRFYQHMESLSGEALSLAQAILDSERLPNSKLDVDGEPLMAV